MQDLPTGYAASQVPNNGLTSRGFCNQPIVDTVVPPTGTAQIGFAKSISDTIVFELLNSFAGSSQAKSYFAKTKSQITSCPSFQNRPSDGAKQTDTISALSFPAVGDESLAVRVTITGSSSPVVADFVIFRKGSTVALLVAYRVEPLSDIGITETVARKAVARI